MTDRKDEMYQKVVAAFNAVEDVLAQAEKGLDAKDDKMSEIAGTAKEALYSLMDLRVVVKKHQQQ